MKKRFRKVEEKIEILSLLQEGYSPKKISELLEVNFSLLLKEIKNGLTDEENKDKRYVKYSPKRSLVLDIANNFGMSAIDYLEIGLEEELEDE